MIYANKFTIHYLNHPPATKEGSYRIDLSGEFFVYYQENSDEAVVIPSHRIKRVEITTPES